MRMHRSLLPLAAFAMSLPGFAASRADAQTVISTVPYTITAAGEYVLGGNLTSTASGPAITISAPNVVLDLNKYYVAGPGNLAASFNSTNSVIYVGNVANVTIKNGTVSGNAFGISFTATTAANSRNYLVDSMIVTRCYLDGVLFAGDIPTPGSIIRNCSFSEIGGSTSGTYASATAIQSGGGVRIENNTIGSITAGGSQGLSTGILGSNGDFAIGNTIFGCNYGILCSSGCKYLNNLTYNCTTPFDGGTNATGNN